MLGDIASLATAVSVLLAALALFAGGRQRKFQVAQSYIDRYWMLLDRHRGSTAPHGASSRRLVEAEPLYKDLCEDQYDIAQIGWIEGRTWGFWHDAIRDAIDHTELPGHWVGDSCRPTTSPPDHGAGAEVLPAQPNRYTMLGHCLADPPDQHDKKHKAHRCPALNLSTRTRVLWWFDRHLLG